MDYAAFTQYMKDQRHILDYTLVSAVAIFLYDYLMTLHLEIKLVWFSRWTYTKILFLLVRYTAFVTSFLLVYETLFPDLSPKACDVVSPSVSWLLAFQISFADVILAIRTWAIWYRTRVSGVGLTALVIADVGVRSFITISTVKSFEHASPPYHGFRGCFLTSVATDYLLAGSALSMTVEIIFLLLMAISAFRLYRNGNTAKGLSYVIHRDGIMFYLYILLLTALNLSFTIAMPMSKKMVFYLLECFLYSVLTARIVLNIRSEGKQFIMIELHTERVESLVFAHTLPLPSPSDEQCPQDCSTYELSILGSKCDGAPI